MVRSDSYNPEPQPLNLTAGQEVHSLEQEVEDLKLKVCQCTKVEEIDVPKEVKKGYKMCLKPSDPLLHR